MGVGMIFKYGKRFRFAPCLIRIRLARLKKFLRPDVALSLPCWLSQFLFLYYEESLVSSNLNSKLFRFHCVRPNQY